MKIEMTTCMGLAVQLTEIATNLIGSGQAPDPDLKEQRTKAAVAMTYEIFQVFHKAISQAIDNPTWPCPKSPLEIGGLATSAAGAIGALIPEPFKGLVDVLAKAAPALLANLPKQIAVSDKPIKMPGE